MLIKSESLCPLVLFLSFILSFTVIFTIHYNVYFWWTAVRTYLFNSNSMLFTVLYRIFWAHSLSPSYTWYWFAYRTTSCVSDCWTMTYYHKLTQNRRKRRRVWTYKQIRVAPTCDDRLSLSLYICFWTEMINLFIYFLRQR